MQRAPHQTRTSGAVPDRAGNLAFTPHRTAQSVRDFSGPSITSLAHPIIQTKLTVNQPGDPFEQEADRVADQVIGMTDSGVAPPVNDSARPGMAQRKCAECENEEKKEIQTKRASGHAEASPDVQTAARATERGGTALPAEVRSYFEPRFGYDFGKVRVHADSEAADGARAVRARAYTLGTDIVFAAGEYSPSTIAGKRLLAHELTHVIQQNGSTCTPTIQRDGSGDVKLAEARQQAEDKLPAKFPSSGVRVIGSGASDLTGILASCTGLDVSIGKDDMLSAKDPAKAPTGTFSATAKTELKRIASTKDGIIIDTNPHAAAVSIGAFAGDTPGYQQLDVANIKVLSAATGVKGGLSACDAVMHEMSEAAFGRTLSLAKRSNIGKTAYDPSHKEGLRVEEGIRKDFGLPQRSTTNDGNLVIIGDLDAKTKVFLESIVFGDGATAKTQLTVFKCHLIAVSATEDTCDNEAVASTVVAGLVKFTTQMEALKVFNDNSKAFGLKPIPVPTAPQKKP